MATGTTTTEALYANVMTMREQLSAGYQVTWTQEVQRADGTFTTSIPDYPTWLLDGMTSASALLKAMGGNYMRRYKDVGPTKTASVPTADLDELASWFVMYTNRERVAVGLIARSVADGLLLALTERLLQVAPPPGT